MNQKDIKTLIEMKKEAQKKRRMIRARVTGDGEDPDYDPYYTYWDGQFDILKEILKMARKGG